MRSHDRPSLCELRDIFLLVGECRELGSDPVVWRRRMGERLCEIFDAKIALPGEAEPPPGAGPQLQQWMVDVGWPDEAARNVYQDWIRQHRIEENPYAVAMFGRMWAGGPAQALPGRLITHSRTEVVDDNTWYGSQFFEMLRALDLDDLLGSFFLDRRGCMQILAVQRAYGQPLFTRRHVRLMWLFHRELVPLMGRELATFETPTIADMSNRLRQSLICMLQGDSEKQAAQRLGVSRHTVHEYVKQLHRHFAASSRAELVSRCSGLFAVLKFLERDWQKHLTIVATDRPAFGWARSARRAKQSPASPTPESLD